MKLSVLSHFCLNTLLTVSLLTPAPRIVRAESLATHQHSSPQALLAPLVHQIKTKTQLLVLLSLGSSGEAFKNIREQLSSLPEALPAIELTNDQLSLNGRSSGVMITSYSPLRVKNQGQIWTYDSTKARDAQFRALRNFLSAHAKYSYVSLFTGDKALADAAKDLRDQSRSELLTAAMLLVSGSILVSGGLVGAAGAGVYFMAAGLFAYMGLGNKLTSDALNGDSAQVKAIFDSKYFVECKPGLVTIRRRLPSTLSKSEGFSIAQNNEGLRFNDLDGKTIDPRAFDQTQLMNFRGLISSCSSNEEAEKINNTMDAAAVTASDPSIKSPPTSSNGGSATVR